MFSNARFISTRLRLLYCQRRPTPEGRPSSWQIIEPCVSTEEKSRAFSIYKKIRKFSIGNFRLGKRVPFVTSPILWRPGRLIDRERHGTGDKDNKSVNGTRIFHWEVSTRKTGLPFQEFRLFRKISSGTNQKVVFHLQPDRNFRNFLVNGKRSSSQRKGLF